MQKKVTRCQFIGIVTVVACYVFAGCGLTASAGDIGIRKKNVLLIVADDLNMDLGCYGNKVVSSSNLDRLAGMGIRFDHAYCQNPVCSPSRSSFLTGLRPKTTHVINNDPAHEQMRAILDKGGQTLSGLFKANGYTTAGFQKIFHDKTYFPESWDHYSEGGMTPLGQKTTTRNLSKDGELSFLVIGTTLGDDDDLRDGSAANKAIAVLDEIVKKQRDKSDQKPFFMSVGFVSPHGHWIVPEKYIPLYPNSKLQLYKIPMDASTLHETTLPMALRATFLAFSDKDKMDYMRSYYGLVSHLDTCIGKLLDAMDRLKLWDDTIVVFVSDHGYMLGQHDWWNKATVMEDALKAPLMVVTPDLKHRGELCSSLIEFIDIFPTLTDLCGLEPPTLLEGKSFAPLLSDPKKSFKKAAFSSCGNNPNRRGYSVRTERYRYSEWYRGEKPQLLETQLFDHKTDPQEYYNLADDPRYDALKANLKNALKTMDEGKIKDIAVGE